VEFKLLHESEQAEAGNPRQVEAEVAGIAFAAQARLLAAARLNTELKLH